MAIELATAYVTLASSTKGLGKDIVAEYGKAGNDGAKSFGKNMTSGLKGMVAGIVGAIGITKIAGFLGGYVSEAIAASDATDKFKQTLKFAGLKGTVIDQLTASTQKYADQTVYSLADIQNTTAQLAANGVPNYDKLAQAAGNLNAVAGGNSDTFKSVAMVLTQTAGAGKLTTENWNQLADAIPGASGMLQEALRKNGAYTGNFRDAMAKGQISAEEFNKALIDLGMTDVAKEAATSTATIEGAWGNFEATIVGGLGEIIGTVKPVITGFLGLLSTAAGSAFTAVNGIVVKIVAGLQPLGQAMSGALGGLGGILGNLAAQAGPILGQIVAQVAPILQQLGPGLLAAFQPLADVLPGLLSGFTEAGPALSPMMIVLQAIQPIIPQLVQALSSFASMVASNFASVSATVLPVLVQLGGLITSQLVPALTTLISAILPPLSTLFGVVAQVFGQVLAAVMPLVSSLLGILVPVIGQLVTMLAPLISQLLTALVPAFQLVGTVVGVLVGILTAVLIPVIQALMPVVTTVFGVIVNVISAALQIITGVINVVMGVLSGNWGQAWQGILGILEGVWNLIKSVVMGAISIVWSVIVGVWNALVGIVTNIWNAIFNAVRGPMQQVVNTVRTIIATVQSVITNTWNTIKSTTESAWNGLRNAVVGGVNNVINTVRDLPGKIIGVLSGVGSRLFSIGTDMIQGLINGVKNMAGRVDSAVKDVVNDAVNAAKNALGIKSPSRVFMQIGRYTGEGLEQGMLATQGIVSAAGDRLAQAATIDTPASSIGGLGGQTDLVAALRGALDGMSVDLDNGRLFFNRHYAEALRTEAMGVRI